MGYPPGQFGSQSDGQSQFQRPGGQQPQFQQPNGLPPYQSGQPAPKKKGGCLKVGGFILLVLFALVGLTQCLGGNESSSPAPVADEKTSAPAAPSPAVQAPTEQVVPAAAEPAAPASKEPAVPVEHRNALAKAQSYSDMMHMSKKGLYDQLTSDYGEKFPVEAAQYAVDNVKADWNQNALAKAKDYQESMNMSKESIRDQLTSEYGEKFTAAEADYAVKNL